MPPEADTTSSGEQPISVDEVAHFETPPGQLLCDESPMAFPGVLLGAHEGELAIPLREQKRDSRGEALCAHVLLVARFPKSPERFAEMQVIDAFFGEKRFEYAATEVRVAAAHRIAPNVDEKLDAEALQVREKDVGGQAAVTDRIQGQPLAPENR